jgi:hypothetical protein
MSVADFIFMLAGFAGVILWLVPSQMISLRVFAFFFAPIFIACGLYSLYLRDTMWQSLFILALGVGGLSTYAWRSHNRKKSNASHKQDS